LLHFIFIYIFVLQLFYDFRISYKCNCNMWTENLNKSSCILYDFNVFCHKLASSYITCHPPFIGFLAFVFLQTIQKRLALTYSCYTFSLPLILFPWLSLIFNSLSLSPFLIILIQFHIFLVYF